ncbi:MAG: Gfo/Idh/MocA family oxidoreductase [Opitutaceae bacterium]|nr:Gfo/Idh/MocA family oxidoreductase [Opitutaceae bacterium]
MNSRRSFLRDAGLLVAGLPLALRAASPTKNQRVGVCLVGLGSYSTNNLAPALELTEHCHLTGIVTGSPEKIPVWQAKYRVPDRNVYSYTTFSEMANNPAIDVAYIVLPTGLHAKYSILAAEAGKHVWCEKPMALTTRECQAMIDACRRNAVTLTIGYRMQHEPNTRRFMEWARTQPYGKLRTIRAEVGYRMTPNFKSWRWQRELSGSGPLYDLGVYSVNALRYAAQEEPIAIRATHTTQRKEQFRDIPEITEFTLEFPSGLVGHGKHTSAETVNLLRVDCERGWYQLSPFQTYGGISGETSDGKRFSDAVRNQQAKQMDNDALAILNGTDVLVPGNDGLRDIALLEAIERSVARGERVSLA